MMEERDGRWGGGGVDDEVRVRQLPSRLMNRDWLGGRSSSSNESRLPRVLKEGLSRFVPAGNEDPKSD